MGLLRDLRFILIAVGLVLGGTGFAYLNYVESELEGQIDKEFGLSESGTDFVFECVFNSDGVFDVGDDVPMWDFCGCLGTEMANLLDDEELGFAAYLILRHDRTGAKVPTASTARSAVERRVAAAMGRGTRICWEHLDLNL